MPRVSFDWRWWWWLWRTNELIMHAWPLDDANYNNVYANTKRLIDYSPLFPTREVESINIQLEVRLRRASSALQCLAFLCSEAAATQNQLGSRENLPVPSFWYRTRCGRTRREGDVAAWYELEAESWFPHTTSATCCGEEQDTINLSLSAV